MIIIIIETSHWSNWGFNWVCQFFSYWIYSLSLIKFLVLIYSYNTAYCLITTRRLNACSKSKVIICGGNSQNCSRCRGMLNQIMGWNAHLALELAALPGLRNTPGLNIKDLNTPGTTAMLISNRSINLIRSGGFRRPQYCRSDTYRWCLAEIHLRLLISLSIGPLRIGDQDVFCW